MSGAEAQSGDGKVGEVRPGSQEAREFLRAFLAAHDEPCPACGYNLRGLTGGACPECAEELRLRVGMVEPRLAHFIAGLIGLTMGFGFFAILHVVLVQAYFNGIPMGWREGVLVTGPAVVLGGAMLWWIRRRRWIRRRPAAQRMLLLAGAWVLPATCVLLAFLFLE